MSDPYIGEIRMFSFPRAPRNWAICNGRVLPYYQFASLASIIHNRYGGDGINTIGLPNLQGRAALHFGKGIELSHYQLAQQGGFETVALTEDNMPENGHYHSLYATESNGTSESGEGKYLAQGVKQAGKQSSPWPTYVEAPPDTVMSDQAIAPAGKGQGHDNRQPYLTVNFCIALYGVFPPRAKETN